MSKIHPLYTQFPPSAPCSCDTCRIFCLRPGWPLVSEAREAIDAGFGDRMMIELSPDLTFAVLSPAFRGNEGFFACREFSGNGCTFLNKDGCEIFNRSFRPLECRYCHHSRKGSGEACHRKIEKDWHTKKGKRLVEYWLRLRFGQAAFILDFLPQNV